MHRTLVALVVLLASSPAFAQTAPEPAPDTIRPPAMSPRVETEPVAPDPAPTPTKRWYGWQILLADVGTMVIAAASGHGEIALGWVASGAIVHAAHGNGGRAVASVLLRAGAPIAGVFAGIGLADCSDGGDHCGLGEAAVGFLLGMLTAEIVDIAIANDTVYDSDATDAVVRRTRRGVTPVVQARDGHVGLGLSGRF